MCVVRPAKCLLRHCRLYSKTSINWKARRFKIDQLLAIFTPCSWLQRLVDDTSFTHPTSRRLCSFTFTREWRCRDFCPQNKHTNNQLLRRFLRRFLRRGLNRKSLSLSSHKNTKYHWIVAHVSWRYESDHETNSRENSNGGNICRIVHLPFIVSVSRHEDEMCFFSHGICSPSLARLLLLIAVLSLSLQSDVTYALEL